MAWRRTISCACIALACALGAPAADAAKKRTIGSELKKLYRTGKIDQLTYQTDRAILRDVKRRIKRLSGTRKDQLAGVLETVDGMAKRGQLRAGRLYPVFLTLERNAEWCRRTTCSRAARA